MYLGYLPRMGIVHTSETEIGQIYIPILNWTLAVFVLALVVGFQTSTNLASAYGVAVTGTMVIDTVLIALVMVLIWHWPRRYTVPLVAFFLIVDLSFFFANSTKILHGGWFPLTIGLGIFLLLTTWNRGRALLKDGFERNAIPEAEFFRKVAEDVVRVPGTAIFLANVTGGVPLSLLNNLKHNHILHERVILLSVIIEEVPYVSHERRVEGIDLGCNCNRVNLHYGYMQSPNIPQTLAEARYNQLGFIYRAGDRLLFPQPQDGHPQPQTRHADLARKTLRLDVPKLRQPAGVLLPAIRPRGGTGRAGGDLRRSPHGATVEEHICW